LANFVQFIYVCLCFVWRIVGKGWAPWGSSFFGYVTAPYTSELTVAFDISLKSVSQ